MERDFFLGLINVFLFRPFLVDVVEDKEIIEDFVLVESAKDYKFVVINNGLMVPSSFGYLPNCIDHVVNTFVIPVYWVHGITELHLLLTSKDIQLITDHINRVPSYRMKLNLFILQPTTRFFRIQKLWLFFLSSFNSHKIVDLPEFPDYPLFIGIIHPLPINFELVLISPNFES